MNDDVKLQEYQVKRMQDLFHEYCSSSWLDDSYGFAIERGIRIIISIWNQVHRYVHVFHQHVRREVPQTLNMCSIHPI